MANDKDNDWTEMYDTITDYNNQNQKPLSNMKIREAIDKLMLEEQAEANNVMVDMFIQQRNRSEDIIGCVTNMTRNDSRNDLIDKSTNMKMNDVRKDLVVCVANLTINDASNYLNGVKATDIQAQFAGNQSGKPPQNLFSSQMIGIRHEEVTVMVPFMEPSIEMNNQSVLNIITGVVQATKAIKLPTMEEVITITTVYTIGANRTPSENQQEWG